MPDGWVTHTWEGYRPFPQVKCAKDGPNASGAVCISEIHGRDGGAIQTSEHYAARSGDVGRITFFARGRGEMWVNFYRWGAKNEWNGTEVAVRIALTNTWQPQEVTIPIANGHACQTSSVTLAIGGLPGSEIQVSEMKLDLQPSDVTGERRLPKSWTVFAPVSADFVPDAAGLKGIPESLAERSPGRASFAAGTLRLAEPEISAEPEACAWFFSAMDSPYDCDFTFRACAAGLRLFLNGEEIPVVPDPQASPVTVRLLKGQNVFALRVPLTDGKAGVRLEGPEELRGGNRTLKLRRKLAEESFDSQTLNCTGNPERIQGNPTPGLLSVTGQGVFRTGSTLEIRLPSEPLALSADEKNHFAVGGLRIQNLKPNSIFEIRCKNKTPAASASSQASSPAPNALPFAACRLTRTADADWSEMEVLGTDGSVLDSFSVANRLFPADLLFGVSADGGWTLSVSSLVASQSFRRDGTLSASPRQVNFAFGLSAKNDADAELTADNLVLGEASWELTSGTIPFKVDVLPEFDPVKAGWLLVFSDEFNASAVDRSKWYFSSTSDENFAKVHDGQLEIACDWNADHSKLKSASLYSNETYGYGYYEARVKFRQQSGWWSAFWLCTHGPSNPFVDGWEIDIYEDYYMGPKTAGEAPRGMLDHNLHVFACGTLRSWNYNSLLPGPVDDFYVVGCKWTPFEVSYYLNGKLIRSEANHSPYDSVTFDPFSHAAGFVPLHAILSGCVGRSGGDPKLGKFPESFFVDYVRIYAFPQDAKPSVTLTESPDPKQFITRPGETLRFSADVQPSAKTGAKIQTVYLFDSGALLDFKTEPPFTFEVPVTRDYYDRTNFVKPGRAGIRPDFDRGLHAFSIFAQDETGQVAHSEPVTKLMRKQGVTRPYLGKVHELPGTILLSHYDEGGQGVAYSDGTPENVFSSTFRPGEAVDSTGDTIGGVGGGEWLKYSVHVAKAGTYVFRFTYGTPEPRQRGPLLLLDDRILGEFQTPSHEADDWRTDSTAELRGIELPEGEHELVLFLQGSYNILNLSAEKAEP